MNRLAIVRGSSNPIIFGKYNIQEIGLAKSLLNYGWSVDIFTRIKYSSSSIPMAQRQRPIGLYVAKGINLPANQGIYPNFFYWLNKINYDVVQIQDDTSIMSHLVSKFAKANGMKTVLWQGMYLPYPGFKGIIQHIFELSFGRNFFKNIDFSIAKTASAVRYLKKKKFTNPSILPVGLDLENFENTNPIDKNLKIFSKTHYPILLYIGKIEPRRNLKFFLNILSNLIKIRTKAGAIIIGNGPDLAVLKRKIFELSLQKNIYFCESMSNDQLPGVYKSADIFLLPSKYEIFGMVILEALFFGLPVIATKEAGPLEIIKHNYLGNCLDFDIKQWVGEILRFTSLHEKYKHIRTEYIKDNYMWANIAEKYSRILNQLVDQQ